ncbi:MAG: S9 family peptidase [Candidatus Hydrogenedentes bacterium]|nr:S9 family peptidase [Candidatus Hydrogenedentota bacterium]
MYESRCKLRALSFLVFACAYAGVGPLAWCSSTLIPRSALFSEPDVTVVRLSPDGASVAYVAMNDTRPEVRVRALANPSDDHRVDEGVAGSVQNLWWTPDDESNLIYQRSAADGTHLYLHRQDGSKAVDLTPIAGASATLARTSRAVPARIVAEIRDTKSNARELWTVDLATSERTLLADMKDVSRIHLDNQLQPRVAERRRLDESVELLRRTESGSWEAFRTLGPDPAQVLGVAGLRGNGETLYVVDNAGRDRSALFEVNVSTGEDHILAEDTDADIRPVAMLDPETGEALSASANFGALRRYHLRKDVSDGFSFLERALKGDVGVSEVSADGRTWLVVPMDGGPTRYFAYQRDSERVVPLLPMYKSLAGHAFGRRVSRVVEVRDGMRLPVHVYLPPSEKGDVPAAPLPTMIYVHGGPHVAYPWDSWITNRNLQLLADRGYAVVRVEFRGAGGMGKRVWDAGAFEWGGAAYRDVLDITAWAVREKIADKDRVGIFGWSYGGYMAMQALTQPGNPYACGISMYGPSDLGVLLAQHKLFFRKRIADERTPEGTRILQEQSPIHHVENLSAPLLMTNGGQDRVNPHKTQADPFVEKAKARGAPLTYLYFPDEQHDYRRPENWIAFWAVAERFLAEHLGGQCEPFGDDLRGATSLQVVAGEQFVPGLAEAL